MTNDLISRSALIEQLEWLAVHEDPLRQSCILGIVHTIANAPAVDAEEVVRCEQCLYRSQYANEEGLYKCGAITCKEGHCAMVAPYFSCIAGKKRGKDDGTSQA